MELDPRRRGTVRAGRRRLANRFLQRTESHGGDLFWTGVLLVLGFAGFFAFDIAVPVILIVLGGVLLIGAFVAQRRAPSYRPGRDEPKTAHARCDAAAANGPRTG